jgi:Cep192 domain 4/FG-GAP repeat
MTRTSGLCCRTSLEKSCLYICVLLAPCCLFAQVGGGAGTAGVVSTGSLEYPIQMVGVSSSQIVTLTNVSAKPLVVGRISVSGDFSQKNDCGRWLTPNSSCSITVAFSPTDLGPRDGTLVIDEKDPSSPQSVTLSGYGVAPIKHIYVHYDYMVLPDQGTACTPRNAFPGDPFSPDCTQSQSCIDNVCRGHSHAPDERAIRAIVEAFRQHGSVLHIDPHHTAIPEHTTIEFGPNSDLLLCPNAIDSVNFYLLRDQYYQPGHKFEHYTIFGHYAQDTQEDDCLFRTGVAELPPFLGTGQNFVVALGALVDEGLPADFLPRWQAGTFMHELGHNLGLNHGGGLFDQGDLINYKPNFISVMNYGHQGGILQADAVGSEQIKNCSRDKDCGPAALCTSGGAQSPHKICNRFDYSDQLLPAGGPTPGDLDENGQLSEPAGLGSGRPDLIGYGDATCSERIGPSDGPVDWDGDGNTTGTGLTVDLMLFWWLQIFPFVDTCPAGPYITVVGHNDWADLAAIQERSHDGHSWKSNPDSHRPHELTLEEAKARHILFPQRPVTILAPSACSSSSLPAAKPSSITLHLLGADDLDVSQVDISSLKLHGIAPATVSVLDVNGDGRPDLVLTFPTTSLKLHPNAKRMTLTGFLKNSQSFWGHAATGCQ